MQDTPALEGWQVQMLGAGLLGGALLAPWVALVQQHIAHTCLAGTASRMRPTVNCMPATVPDCPCLQTITHMILLLSLAVS